MCYAAFAETFEAWHLVVIGVVAYFFGSAARAHFIYARRYGMPIGFILAGLLVLDGISLTNVGATRFINEEFPRILCLLFITTNIFSALFGYLEPILVKARERRLARFAEWKQRQERARQERVAQENARQWEAERPQREARMREEAEERRVEAERKAKAEAEARDLALTEAARRDMARQHVLLAYFASSPKVQEAISWDRLQEFVKIYLADKTASNVVERNAKKLIRTIRGHVQPLRNRTPKPKNLEQICEEFEQKKAVIHKLDITTGERDALMADWAMQRALAMEQRE